ncbi:MAG: hypothetical protein JHC30_03400 [Caldisericum sp.]|nr:hypothetical protein [Caldisericum sp.]
MCKQDTRESSPQVFKDMGLFILPIKNGEYAIIKGEGYVDIPKIEGDLVEYSSKLDFNLDAVTIGD